jgi:predicted molibdopterin-dependent oxidoreductase YjgC
VFGAGGGTSAYQEVEETDLVLLWGSNARETHPIYFHHVLTGLHRGAELYVVDPRRTSSAKWARGHLPLDVGTDIALAHAMGRVILDEGLENRSFIERATSGFDEYVAAVEPWTLERAQEVTTVDAGLIRDTAIAYATADRAQLCWTLGITEHHNAVDNVRALIDLALLTGHVGRWGSGLVPLRGQNNVQGGGDMGAIPNKLPGGYDVEDETERARFERAWGAPIPPVKGLHLSQMFESMDRGEIRAVYIVGENPAESEADVAHARKLLTGLDHLVVQDIFRTATADLADVVFPSCADWCEYEGTVTSSERRVQRVRKAIDPPGLARPDSHIMCDLATRLGHDWGSPTAEQVWDELRSVSLDWHAGMSYARLTEHGGLQWPCPAVGPDGGDHPGTPTMHTRLWERDPAARGTPAPFAGVEHAGPLDVLTAEFPLRLTTVRRLDSYNSGVQTGGYTSPLRRDEALCVDPADAKAMGVDDGERVRLVSRRGAVEAPIRFDEAARPGLAFITPHFSEQVDVNLLTNEAWDPKSGTSEFKATAIRIEKLPDRQESLVAHTERQQRDFSDLARVPVAGS